MSPKEAAAATTMSRFLIALMAKEGRFPQPVKIGVKRIAFVRAEVMDWIDEQIANRQAANDNTTSTPKQDGTVVGHIDGRTMFKPGTLASSAA
ncbi:AlpA family phage regulatory protein [Phyllobacterium salinisoli]|uniref:AlpA family phage regulatory protein n=2 Tax=Phyllobacterium salinisoli TaxID=1899321 RepID=A0A368JZV5_9HYPH|nr:AlpA family phage regulatory protein [Phyllobacterium salinisoli]